MEVLLKNNVIDMNTAADILRDKLWVEDISEEKYKRLLNKVFTINLLCRGIDPYVEEEG